MMGKAKEILKAAQNGNDSIAVTTLQAQIQIYTGGEKFCGGPGKEAAELKAALRELEASGYIEPTYNSKPVGNSIYGSYELTHEGQKCEF